MEGTLPWSGACKADRAGGNLTLSRARLRRQEVERRPAGLLRDMQPCRAGPCRVIAPMTRPPGGCHPSRPLALLCLPVRLQPNFLPATVQTAQLQAAVQSAFGQRPIIGCDE